MKYIDFQDGRIPALGFGTFDSRGEDCVRATATALKIGYRHIDTAQEYDNEIEVGQAINGADIDRGEIFLTTKIWPNRIGKGDLRRAADESLERLATDYIDLLLIHWPSPTISLAESLEALAEVKAAGKAKYIGISNFPITLMHEAVEMHGAGVVCNQVEYHPFLDQRRLIDAARAHGLFVTAYCPLAQGEIDGDPTLGAIARKHGKTPAQVTLRWLIRTASRQYPRPRARPIAAQTSKFSTLRCPKRSGWRSTACVAPTGWSRPSSHPSGTPHDLRPEARRCHGRPAR